MNNESGTKLYAYFNYGNRPHIHTIIKAMHIYQQPLGRAFKPPHGYRPESFRIVQEAHFPGAQTTSISEEIKRPVKGVAFRNGVEEI